MFSVAENMYIDMILFSTEMQWQPKIEMWLIAKHITERFTICFLNIGQLIEIQTFEVIS